jgi:hypothetical protein
MAGKSLSIQPKQLRTCSVLRVHPKDESFTFLKTIHTFIVLEYVDLRTNWNQWLPSAGRCQGQVTVGPLRKTAYGPSSLPFAVPDVRKEYCHFSFVHVALYQHP